MSNVYDLNGNGVNDAIALDQDGDGYEEAIAVDRDENGVVDEFQVDLDDSGDIDVVMDDNNEDGQIDVAVVDQGGDGGLETAVVVPGSGVPDADGNGVDDRLADVGAVVGPATDPDPLNVLLEQLANETGHVEYGTPDSDSDGYSDSQDSRPFDPDYF